MVDESLSEPHILDLVKISGIGLLADLQAVAELFSQESNDASLQIVGTLVLSRIDRITYGLHGVVERGHR